MPTVRLEFSPAPDYVRTARLVGVSVARRAGVADELLDDVRLAIGEACGRAVARHRRHGIDAPVRVEMSDDGPYAVRVIDACGVVGGPAADNRTGSAPDRDATPPDRDATLSDRDPAADEAVPVGDESEADRMGETLLAGLVDQLEVRVTERGTEVHMVWPVRRRLSGTGRGHPAR